MKVLCIEYCMLARENRKRGLLHGPQGVRTCLALPALPAAVGDSAAQQG